MDDQRFRQHTLDNGLTIVVERMDGVQSAACGFLARTGARDDTPELAGVSHFLEHMCFKGSERMSADELNIAFDEIGADNNAQTGKEQTFYYSWARHEDFDRQLELLSEMMRASLPADGFEIERGVILEEIAMYKDDLLSTTYDLLYEKVCAGSTLAWPILGYDRTINSLTRDQMHAYFTHRYRPDNMILVAAGRVDAEAVFASAERLCGRWERVDDPHPPRQPPVIHSGAATEVINRFYQQAVAIAFPSPAATDPLDESAEALAAILGGPNSRFYWQIQQQGLATQVSVAREEYADFGLLILYGLCEPANCEKLVDALRREAEAITRDGPEPKELQRVKNQRRTVLASESEAPGFSLGQIADDVDYRGAPRAPERRLAEVDAVTAESIAACLRKYPITGEGFIVSVGPRNWPDGTTK